MKIETERINIETERIAHNDTERIVHVDTERIIRQLNVYRKEFANHRLFLDARENRVPTHILHEFAFYQYSDSILWIPMLALMKEKVVRSSRLRQAIEENIKHEAGVGGTSHVELAKSLIRSLGLFDVDIGSINHCAAAIKFWLSDEFANMTEQEIAGWLLTAETLVPIMFKIMMASYPNADIAYFSEHVVVDSDEHAQWMIESVEEILRLYGAGAENKILFGMQEAWLEAVEVPNLLQKRYISQPN